MQRGLHKVLGLGVVVALAGLAACGEQNNQLDELVAAQEAVVVELEEAKAALDAKREELDQLKADLEAPEEETASDEATEGEEVVDPEGLKQRAEELKAEIETAAADLGSRIVEFINEDPPIAGEPLNERQDRAITMKIDEDILLAREWIDVGGDYRRAITILEGLVPLAPENARLQQELAQAREMRYMTEERFASVEDGMTEDEVRALLGPVNLRNVRPYEEKKVTAWFYPKDPATGGGAAGVWFKQRKGELVTYKKDFNAINPESGEEADG